MPPYQRPKVSFGLAFFLLLLLLIFIYIPSLSALMQLQRKKESLNDHYAGIGQRQLFCARNIHRYFFQGFFSFAFVFDSENFKKTLMRRREICCFVMETARM